MTSEEREVRDRDADFVQQARELSNHYYANRTDKDDPRAHLTYWLAKGHKAISKIHRKVFPNRSGFGDYLAKTVEGKR